MSKKLRLILIASISTTALISAIACGSYWACQRAPTFYQQALTQDHAEAKQESDALLREAAGLASDLRRPGQWHALFTADQINGWLAYDVLRNHPRLLPPTISQPRVAIENNLMRVAFSWHKPGWSAVVSLETEIYLRETNVIAVKICRARAGLLPLPLGTLLEEFVESAQETGLQIDQEQIEGEPLIVVTLPWASNSEAGKLQMCLEALEVNDGEIYVSGRTQSGQTPARVARHADPVLEPSAVSAEKSNLQR